MATRKRSVAPITVYTNGNQYDAKRIIFNPKYVRTFDALLDQVTLQTNATCAVRRIYTPQGTRQVGKLSSIEPGGRYVAVSRGHFKKLAYGQRNLASASQGTSTTKTTKRRYPTNSRLQKSYDDQMNTQKTIFVYRNGYSEPPTQIFITKRLLRSISQVLDIVQERIVCDRAITSLHKMNGVTIIDVTKLEADGRYVAVEQGQRFKRMMYDHTDAETSSPRRRKLPAINNGGLSTWRSTSEGKPRHRFPSNESSQGLPLKFKPKLKLPVIKQNISESRGFQFVHGYPVKETNAVSNTYRFPHGEENAKNVQSNTHSGVFYATGAQRQRGAEIYDDKRVRIDKPLDMQKAGEVEERLDGVGYQDNRRYPKHDLQDNKHQQRANRQTVPLPKISHVPKPTKDLFPTKPSIAHPRKHVADHHRRSKSIRGSNDIRIPKSIIKDQRFVSQENGIASTKRYVVTREQRLFNMHGRDGRVPAQDVLHAYATGVWTKDHEQKSQEVEKRKRIEQWVDQTVEEKQKEDEIATVAKQLVITVLNNAATTENNKWNYSESTSINTVPSFYDRGDDNGVKYHRVFGQ